MHGGFYNGETEPLVLVKKGLDDNIGLGDGFTARRDVFPMGNGTDFEIHVYYKGKEYGIFGSEGWFNKHGISKDVSIPKKIEDRLKGKAIETMRKQGRLGPKGTDNKGDNWKRPRLGGGC
ncbi:hypothetical protein GCM10009799_33060 [Nocardiopsis rhodophaea]|uniref:Jacalin-type lectin domain-containing protein n=1 Tax=Nocardiopsis rhodophaea TaxID=280238 RepID=A0ABP5ENM0_9ACTN